MKKRISFLLACLSLALLFFSGCRKETVDPTFKPQEVATTPLPGMPTYCRIETLWENPFTPEQRFIHILYDEYENPVSISTPAPSTGHPYRTFKYDHWHRLREYRGEYANGHYEFWHFYGFDNNGRIGVDTMYTFGEMGPNGPLSFFERTISTIEYDAQGRIIKVVSSSNLNPSQPVATYSYDAAGNLIYPPGFGITYDNKMNLNRTNDIWQFLNRDYSMNNPFIADAYNDAGYPTVINTSRDFGWLNEYHIANAQINYSCREAYW
ncbi:MAG TPA: RHS repeat domain-containing protein [Chitinophagaceae bacterium]|nr:RHS repeat domain-containing protein [Chitinophagaceae bacterium]